VFLICCASDAYLGDRLFYVVGFLVAADGFEAGFAVVDAMPT
jgi:hypothetical protein